MNRCWSCGRLLFRGRDGKLPAHRVPQPAVITYRRYSTAPLTGPDQPWCQGGGS